MELGSVGFFGDDLGAEGIAEEVRVTARVFFEDDVVLTDRLGFFLRGERRLVHRPGGRAACQLSGYGCFSRSALACGLFAAGIRRFRRGRRRRRPTRLLTSLYYGSIARPILYCHPAPRTVVLISSGTTRLAPELAGRLPLTCRLPLRCAAHDILRPTRGPVLRYADRSVPRSAEAHRGSPRCAILPTRHLTRRPTGYT